MTQGFSHNHVECLNTKLKEKVIAVYLQYKDNKAIIINKKDIAYKESLFKSIVVDFFKKVDINIRFSEDGHEIQLYKTIEVVAAVIKGIGINSGKIFAAQRGYGDLQGGWEFPGGKMEVGETPQEALVREIEEELDTRITVGDAICTVDYNYSTFHLIMHVYWCELVSGKFDLLEHKSATWLSLEELESVNWLPADIEVVEKIKKYY